MAEERASVVDEEEDARVALVRACGLVVLGLAVLLPLEVVAVLVLGMAGCAVCGLVDKGCERYVVGVIC